MTAWQRQNKNCLAATYVNSCKHPSVTSNWKVQLGIQRLMTNIIVNTVINATAMPELPVHVQNQTVTQLILASHRDTIKQAWISNVVAETPSDWRKTEAASVRNISHLRPRTGSRCAWYILTLFMLLCQYLTKPLWSAVNIHRSLWLQIIVLTAVSWAYTSHIHTTNFCWPASNKAK